MKYFFKPKFFLAIAMLFAFLSLYSIDLMSNTVPQLSATAEHSKVQQKKSADNYILDGDVTLWDQLSNLTSGVAGQDFEDAYNAYDCMGADDFSFSGVKWKITQFQARFFYSADGGPVNTFNIRIYSNNNGVPGTLLNTFSGLNYTVSGITFTITLPNALTLNPGTYWVSIQGQQDFASVGQCYWYNSNVSNSSYKYKWMNPGNGFGLGTDWVDGETGWPDNSPWNFSFSVIGEKILDTPTLTSPANQATYQSVTPSFSWGEVTPVGSYQLQVSTSSTFGTTAINATGLTSTSYNVSTALAHQTTYYWRVRAVSGDVNSDWSDVRSFTTLDTPPTDDYCYAYHTGQSEYISNVSFGSISNTSGWQSNVGFYLAQSTNVTHGNNYNMTVTLTGGSSSNYVRVWIDWNQDGDWEEANEVYNLSTANNGQTFIGTINVPNGAALGDARMRVRLARGAAPTPCGAAEFGEIEDYTVKTILASPVLATPANGTENVSLTPTFTWNSVTMANNYELQVSKFNNFATTEVNATGIAGTSYSVMNQLEYETTYFWRVRAKSGDTYSNWSNVWDFTTPDAPPDDNYCFAQATSQNEYISGLSFSNVNNNSLWQSFVGFYTYLIAEVERNESYNIQVTVANGSSSNYVTAWIDWNGDEDFEEANEVYTLSTANGGQTFTGTIDIPATAPLGNTRLRVRLTRGTTPMPCGVTDWGEVEDYTVKVLPEVIPGPTLLSPADNATDVNVVGNLNWQTVSGANSYLVQVATNSQFTNFIVNTIHESGTQYSFSPGQLNYLTQYYWRIRAYVGETTSEWSDAWRFTTMQEPGEYCNAMTENEQEYISRVQFEDIDNESDWQNEVADYINQVAGLYVDNEYTLTVTNGEPNSNAKVTAWIDWNSDYEYSANEAYVLTSADGGETFTAAIAIDEDAIRGYYRMRIRMTVGSDPDPCGSSAYGEVEEYTVNIVDGWIAPAPMLSSPEANATGVPLMGTFDWNFHPAAENYRMQISTDPTMMDIIYDTDEVSENEYTLPAGLLTLYQETLYWRVRLEADGEYSQWSETRKFTTTRVPAPQLTLPANGATNVSLTPQLRFNTVPYADNYSILMYAGEIIHIVHGLTAEPGESEIRYTVPDGVLQEYLEDYSWFAVGYQGTRSSSAWWGGWEFTTRDMPNVNLLFPAHLATEVSRTPDFGWVAIEYTDTYVLNIYHTVGGVQTLYHSEMFDGEDYEAGSAIIYSLSDMYELEYYTDFWWEVKAYHGDIEKVSEMREFRTEIFPAPTLVSPADNASNVPLEPTFVWNKIPSATTYTLYVYDGEELVYSESFDTEDFSGATMSHTLSSANTLTKYVHEYSWFVVAEKFGTEVESTTFTFTTVSVPIVNLLLPANFAEDVHRLPTFRFATVPFADTYYFELANLSDYDDYYIFEFSAADYEGEDYIEFTLPEEYALDFYQMYAWTALAIQGENWSFNYMVRYFTTGKVGGELAINAENISLCRNSTDAHYLGSFKYENSTTATGGSGDYTYQWTPTVGLSFPLGMANPKINPITTITYNLKVTDNVTGEQLTQSITVTINLEPKILMSPLVTLTAFDIVDNLNDFANIQDGTGMITYNWRDNNGYYINPENYVVMPGLTRLYLQVWDEAGCVSLEKRLIIYAPLGRDIYEGDVAAGNNGTTFMWAYPTPFKDNVNIKALFSESTEATLKVLDLAGREILSMNIHNANDIYETNLDLSTLSAGVYFIVIDTPEDSVIHQVIKE